MESNFLTEVFLPLALFIIMMSMGMSLNLYLPQFATKVEKLAKWLSLFFLALIIFGILLVERANLASYIYQIGWAVLALNISTMAYSLLMYFTSAVFGWLMGNRSFDLVK